MNRNKDLIINNITKLYNNNQGIKSISTEIKSGEITAFIGPNGVGKTTLVKAIAGITPITTGEILLSGVSTLSRVCKPNIGYMQSDLNFYNSMTVYEVLNFICKVKFSRKYHEEIDLYLKKYALYEQRNSLINNLSFGMQKKLSIIMALIGTPKLIILDEPTNGVDTYGIIQLKNDLIRCSQANCIIIVTSHILDWIEKICTRCIFLKSGRIAEDLPIKNNSYDLEALYEKIYLIEK